jgi:hypothetical protein
MNGLTRLQEAVASSQVCETRLSDLAVGDTIEFLHGMGNFKRRGVIRSVRGNKLEVKVTSYYAPSEWHDGKELKGKWLPLGVTLDGAVNEPKTFVDTIIWTTSVSKVG